MTQTQTFAALRGPLVDSKGNASRDFTKKLQEWENKLTAAITLFGTIASTAKIQGRTEGIGTTASKLNSAGQLTTADQIAADGATFARVNATAITANNVDLSKVGVVGPLGSAKLNKAVMLNYSNNATVDSIDNGVNATVRVYGPGGVGTTWHQFIGGVVGPEISSLSGAAAYATNLYAWWDGVTFHLDPTALNAMQDGAIWGAFIKTVAAGGGGGQSGGGGSNGAGGGRMASF